MDAENRSGACDTLRRGNDMTVVTLADADRTDTVLATATFRGAAEVAYVSGTASEVTNPSTGVYVLALPIATDRTHAIRGCSCGRGSSG